MELISVIVPVYNSEKYLKKCLDSLKNQTWNNLQIILIDDGSGDNSAEICQKYCDNDIRFEYIFQKNQGVSAARNAGLDHAKGNYIGFCDSDDWVEKNMYEVLYNLLHDYDADISSCGYTKDYFDQRNDSTYIGMDFPANKMTNIEALIQMHLEIEFIGVVWNKLFKRELFNNIYFNTDILIDEDALMCGKLIERSQLVVFQNIPLYHYVFRSDSAFHSDFSDAVWTHQISLRELYKQMLRLSPENAMCAQSRLIKKNLRIAERLILANKLTVENYNRIYNEIAPYISMEAVNLIYNPKARLALKNFLKGRDEFMSYRKANNLDW